ncbi:excinuclease ABC subunit UvrC [Coxiella burnetii]|uniref:excinuclease ABC subunit UvrC n=1 Tax=Coxiella burnetii TaxID=777 RepID=UPI000594CA11|nr:excinuclease ABC subunit UvrC [Coxiella burnetii]
MTIDNPSAFLKTLPTGSGVYQMQDAQGKVIYVGKARNLQKRVSSYFRRQLDSKTQAMMAQVQSIQTTITRNENEALLLEASFIKQFRPRYNVLLRDDKSYPYLYLATHQKFPLLDFYRGAKKAPGRYFGPYPNAGSVRENLALIQKLFKLRQCSESFFKNRTRPCLQYQIKRCTAPCVGYVNEQEYRRQVEDAILFFEGKNDQVIIKLTERMEVASENLVFEEAAHYRDQIRQLRRLQKQQIITGGKGNIDIIGIAESNGAIGFAILFIRSGRMIGHKPFFPNTPLGTTLQTALVEFIPQYYLSPLRNGDIPERIVTSEPLEDRLWIQRALSSGLNRKLAITDQKRAPYKQWQAMAALNAAQALSQHLAQKNTFALKLEAIQKSLALPNPIARIECFDISHTLGEATVASCVVFGEEGPIKKDYRRFNISGVTPGDDYGALRQALTRRYVRLKEGEGILPDVLLIDGGMGQLRQAAEVLEELQVSGVILTAIAKGPGRKAGLEKLFVWGRREEIHLPADNIAFHLIQQIRDEAHRFAITAHCNRRAKRRVESTLQEIEGIGPKRRQKLLKYFGGLQELQRASIEEIARVPGVSETLAKAIYDACHQHKG